MQSEIAKIRVGGVKLLIVSSAYTMKSGLSWSLVGMASVFKENGLDVNVLLPKHGDLESNLQKNDVPCKVIPYFKHGWYSNGKKQRLSNKIKSLLKAVVNRVALARIEKLIKREKYTLVHINALTDDMGARAAINTNTKFVWHIREFMEEDLGICFSDPERAHREMNYADCMIAVSGEVKKKFQPYVQKDIKVVYNGIDIDRFYQEREILNKDTITICMVGRLLPQKGQLQLADAVIMLGSKGYSNIHVRYIGVTRDEAYLNQIKQNVENAKMTDRFEFFDFANNIEDYYHKADVVCVCSTKEAFGRVTVEGMVSGALVVGAKSGGTLELITDGETGYFYDGSSESLADVLEHVLQNKEEARQVARNGQAWASEQFTVERNAEEILKVYGSV